jgi:predicted nucleotidyltransferase
VPRDDGAILAHLNAAGIDYVVIGGWAVIAHGYVRATQDVDVLVADTVAVRRQVTAALAALEATRLNGTVLTADLAMPDQGWQVNTRLGRVDVLLEGPPPLDLASVQAGAEQRAIDGTPVLISGLAHLVAFKRLANRTTDRADLEELERILQRPLPRLALPGIDD